ncbi:MAG: HD domain-containing protein [Candidatus Gastranaerophilales bacterium]|nr:HD domain-containing protein [Candidatus Gastranaerophilales bacterium]
MLNIKSDLLLNSVGDLISATSAHNEHTILIVDDEINNLQLLKRTFRNKYKILTASNGLEGLETLKRNIDNISLIVSDHKMPIMEGTKFLEEANSIAPDVIKILLTGFSDVEIITDAVNKCNLYQYILKPFNPEELQEIVKNGLDKFDLASSKSLILKDLKELFYKTIKSIASALDAKDPYTHGHSMRVTLYSIILAKELNIPQAQLEMIETAGLLHDIGKIAIPESILCKPGKLTDDEFLIMKTHPINSEKLIASIKKLDDIVPGIKHHHERWDGRGYPDNLQGENIPYHARIIALADTYDAMTSTRSYRKALDHEVAIAEIEKCAGSQFDPNLAKEFIAIQDIIKAAKENPEEYYLKYSTLYKEIK